MTDDATRPGIPDRFRRLAARFGRLVDGVPAGAWENPTPCSEWDTRELVRHVVDSQALFLGLIGRSAPEGPSVDVDPAGAWSASSAAVQSALDDPAVASEEFDGFFGRTRFDVAVDRFVCLDLVVHGWDLARATGQDEEIPAEDLDHVRAVIPTFGEALHAPGVCGPPVEVADHADDQTRLLAQLGRG